MRYGRFPKPADSVPVPATYSPGSWNADDLDPVSVGETSRRQWIFGVAGLVAGATVSWCLGSSSVGATGATMPEVSAPESELPAWVLDLESKPDEDLMQWAGDLERLTFRFRTEARLVPTFERLIDFVLESEGALVDTAGACATRGLMRLGRADSVIVRRRRIASRRDLVETNSVAEQVIEDHTAQLAQRK